MAESVIREFITLVEIDSPPRTERILADYLKSRFSKLGVELQEDGAANAVVGNAGNLYGLFPGSVESEPILLCAHMDTVRSNQGVEVVEEDGHLRSKAKEHILGADDKAGIAAIITLLDQIKKTGIPHPPIEVLFTVCEEVGLLGSKFFDPAQLRSKEGYVLDSSAPVGSVVTRSPVHNEFVVKVFGRAAHAGSHPELGINAIQLASRLVSEIKLGRIDEYTTANIGKISGGVADNVVPEYAELTGEVRSHKPHLLENYKQMLTEAAKRIVASGQGQIEVEFSESFPSLCLSEDLKVIKTALQAASACGFKSALISTGGGSDANILNNKGITCANLGIGVEMAHSSQESVSTKNLTDLVKLMLAIIKEW